MLINEVSKCTGLTKKAIEYYTLQGLVKPSVLENGYREYSEQDRIVLNQIGVLRKLDISLSEIEQILTENTNLALQEVLIRKELENRHNQAKRAMIEKLIHGASYASVHAELQTMEKNKSITEKLLDAFPGYYGRFICLHFARFLTEPIQTKMQQDAYEKIISFLDNIPLIELPEELEDYLMESTNHISVKQITEILDNTKRNMEKPEEFLRDNKEILVQYVEYRQSEEYRNSPDCRLLEKMKLFNSTNGYNTIFIPAMKQLSTSYFEYCQQLEDANEKFLEQFPEIAKINN